MDENQEGLISWKQGQERFKNETMTNYAKCHCQEDQEAATGLAWVIDDSDRAQGTEPVLTVLDRRSWINTYLFIDCYQQTVNFDSLLIRPVLVLPLLIQGQCQQGDLSKRQIQSFPHLYLQYKSSCYE